VPSISIETIRCGGPARVCEELMALGGGRVCVVNIASGRDLLVFVLGLLQAEAMGKRFLYRTAASFAAARAGIASRPVLAREELSSDGPTPNPSAGGEPRSSPPGRGEGWVSGGGLVVVGSYVPTSSEQLRHLLASGSTENVEVNVRAVLAKESHAAEVRRASEALNAALMADRDSLLYTSRELVTGCDGPESLDICRRVSEAVLEILERITVRPRFVVAKGGITSSDVATRTLRVKRALVLGQILPGVPLWRLGDESRWPGLIYVSFPGNLGGATVLREVLEKLSGNREICHRTS
jgi:uncharacterized protein YgbK (DUF1537 family)